jgi:hypothetical protein
MTRDERIDLLRHALIGYHAQAEEIEKKITEIRRELSRRSGAGIEEGATGGTVATAQARRKHQISKAGRARIAAATRERWRKARAAGRTTLG